MLMISRSRAERHINFWSWLYHSWHYFSMRGPDSLRDGLNLPSDVNGYEHNGFRLFGIDFNFVYLASYVRERV